MAECDLEHTFVTSDHHFRDWMHLGGVLAESTKEEEAEHIALWNSVVGKDDLVLYSGALAESTQEEDSSNVAFHDFVNRRRT